MRNDTNMNALRAMPGFYESLLPSNDLVQARQTFDTAGKNVTPEKYAEAMIRINKANNICAKLVRDQYQPVIKTIVLALLKDWKLSTDEVNATCAPQMQLNGELTYDGLERMVFPLLKTSIQGSNAFLHIANAVKPMILKALKELASEGLATSHKPRHKSWGAVSSYSAV
jgi:hypothetical protein